MKCDFCDKNAEYSLVAGYEVPGHASGETVHICSDCLDTLKLEECECCGKLVPMSILSGMKDYNLTCATCRNAIEADENIEYTAIPKNLIYRVFDFSSSHRSVSDWWKSEVARDPQELGLLGEWYVEPDSTPAENLDVALRILAEKAIPYCGAVCVKYNGLSSTKPANVKYQERKYEMLSEKLHELDAKLLESMKSASSLKIGCKYCGSSIRRSYLESVSCPVCKSSLLAETYQKRRDAAVAAVESVEKNLDKTEYQMVPGVCYLVGGYSDDE